MRSVIGSCASNLKEANMDKKKIAADFLECAFYLGQELVKKDKYHRTEREEKFLSHLDKMLLLMDAERGDNQ